MIPYCLFCDTIKCELVAEQIERQLGHRAFSPKIIQRKWVKGTAMEETKTLLPGYVFVYADAPVEFPRTELRLDHVIRVLGHKDENYALSGGDRRFAEMLWNCGGVIGILKAFKEGERVRLAEGALGGVEGEIVRLDRRKGRAQIRYQFAGAAYTAWVGYELIEDGTKVDLRGNEDGGEGAGSRE